LTIAPRRASLAQGADSKSGGGRRASSCDARGNRRQPVFFSQADYRSYMTLLAKACKAAHVAVWTYWLMPDHVQLILVPRGPSQGPG